MVWRAPETEKATETSSISQTKKLPGMARLGEDQGGQQHANGRNGSGNDVSRAGLVGVNLGEPHDAEPDRHGAGAAGGRAAAPEHGALSDPGGHAADEAGHMF